MAMSSEQSEMANSLVREPGHQPRNVEHSFDEGTITIADKKQPTAWISSDEYIEFGGGQ